MKCQARSSIISSLKALPGTERLGSLSEGEGVWYPLHLLYPVFRFLMRNPESGARWKAQKSLDGSASHSQSGKMLPARCESRIRQVCSGAAYSALHMLPSSTQMGPCTPLMQECLVIGFAKLPWQARLSMESTRQQHTHI